MLTTDTFEKALDLVDIFREILHVYAEHVKKALALVLLSGKF